VEIKGSPQREFLQSAGTSHLAKGTIRLTPSRNEGRECDLASRDDTALHRLEREDDLERLTQLRDKNIRYAQIAMFICLAFLATGLILVIIYGVTLQNGLQVGVITGLASASTLYLRSTFLKTVETILSHIQEMRDCDNRRADQDARWKVIQMVVEAGGPDQEMIIGALSPSQREAP
jgi:hypothetical protein